MIATFVLRRELYRYMRNRNIFESLIGVSTMQDDRMENDGVVEKYKSELQRIT